MARKVLTCFGISNHSKPAVLMALLGICTVVLWLCLDRRPKDAAWRFGVLAVSAFVSFSLWGQFIHSYHEDPGSLFDYTSSGYYYHCPVALLVVLSLGAVWLRFGRERRVVLLGLAAVMVVSNLSMFPDVDRVVQRAHLARFGAESIMLPLRSGVSSATANIERSLEVEEEYQKRASRLTTRWKETNFTRDFQQFRSVPFDPNYPMMLCLMYSDPCRLSFTR